MRERRGRAQGQREMGGDVWTRAQDPGATEEPPRFPISACSVPQSCPTLL